MEISVTNSSSLVTKPSNTKEGERYSYYDVATGGGSPYKYKELLNTAKKYIAIWDPYLNKGDERIFDSLKGNKLEILILCSCDDYQSEVEISDIADKIYAKISSTDSTLQIKCYRNRKIGGRYFNINALWHDRYLIIDKETVYLVGSSINNQISGNLSSGIYKIDDGNAEDKKIIIDAFINYCYNVNRENKNGSKNGFTLNRPCKSKH